MSNLSSFIAGAGGGIASIQTDFIDVVATVGSAGEDNRYTDITIAAVNTAKAVPFFEGGNGTSLVDAMTTSRDGSGGINSVKCTARLTSSTNLRIASAGAQSRISGRWHVVETN